ncbi:hypothetical protein F5Y18DRAFT_415654 [Xylariaceae sp. FL1019]|nr:hypothetical protein F5Y18DRAFT_415654 [Xylariaceae sp. FL1019]
MYLNQDPGTALGVVSLGIEKDYKDNVCQTCEDLASLEKTLKVLSHRLESIMSNTKTSDLPPRVTECLTICHEEGIQRLQRKLKNFPYKDPTTILQKVRVNAIRITYPLRASTLTKLKETIEDMLDRLNLAIQTLLLDYSAETFKTVARIDEYFGNIKKSVSKIQSITLDTSLSSKIAVNSIRTLLEEQNFERVRRVLQWLNAPNHSINHNKARNQRKPGTGT